MIKAADALDTARRMKVHRMEAQREYAKQTALSHLTKLIEDESRLGKRSVTWRVTSIGAECCENQDFSIAVVWTVINEALDENGFDYSTQLEFNQETLRKNELRDVVYKIDWSRARWAPWIRSWVSCELQ